MNEFHHSVTLDADRCKGCINCVKYCPNEAIRVRGGKASIISERCIDCGECVRVCPQHAKRAVSDPLADMQGYEWKVALPAPALYGQFPALNSIEQVLEAFLQIGFNDVYEVGRAAEIISECTRRMLASGLLPTPVISSACPAVTRLIRVRFPNLCRNVLPLIPPVELAARNARAEAAQKTGLPAEKIGVFFISPCPAKVSYARAPMGVAETAIDHVFSIAEVYPALSEAIKHPKPLPEGEQVPAPGTGIIGVNWAGSGGEASALFNEKYLAADGIRNVIQVLEELEDEKLSELEFIELNACSGGCVGGVFNVENPYVAKARLQRLRKYLPVSRNRLEGEVPANMVWTLPLAYMPVMTLDDDVSRAMQKMMTIEQLTASMPGLDCGSCGAPSCRALAEDIVRGTAQAGDCVFVLRDRIHTLVQELSELEGYVPPPFRDPRAGASGTAPHAETAAAEAAPAGEPQPVPDAEAPAAPQTGPDPQAGGKDTHA